MLFISTSGHGYLRVTLNQLKTAIDKGFTPTSYSFINSNAALLEEDNDSTSFLKAMGKWDQRGNIKTRYQNDINKNLYYHINKESIKYCLTNLPWGIK